MPHISAFALAGFGTPCIEQKSSLYFSHGNKNIQLCLFLYLQLPTSEVSDVL